MCQLAVERELTIIGDASKKILDGHGEFVRDRPELPFKKAYDLRIKLTHGYTSINARTVWGTIRDDLSGFAQEIPNILPDLLKERDNIQKKGRNDRGMGGLIRSAREGLLDHLASVQEYYRPLRAIDPAEWRDMAELLGGELTGDGREGR